jgi:8-oxo-dGTP pyrophosphatase MutT (NUDIX family)
MVVEVLKGKQVPSAIPEAGFLRHVAACNNADLPGDRLAFSIGAQQVGWVKPGLVPRLERFPTVHSGPAGLALAHADALPAIARTLADEGLCRWRAEAFDVRADPSGPVLSRIDRGAVPVFGIFAVGVHLNGLVQRADGLYLWVARRAADKLLDPGKLDHIVAGGVPAELTPEETLVKEAAEEAAIPADLVRQARWVGTIGYAMDRREGLRRDHLRCYDLMLPEDFEPHATDGEVEGFELWPIAEILNAVRTSDRFKFNVNLVLIDLFLRLGLIEAADATPLRNALAAGRI